MHQELAKLWRKEVAANYSDGKITTERALQAVLYMLIRSRLPEVEVFVEPGLMYYDAGSPRFRPDIVLCHGTTIELFCELKFVPHWHPNYYDDLDKLARLSREGTETEHKLRIDPKSGTFGDNVPHEVSRDTQYAFMVIGRADSHAVVRESLRERIGALDSRFSLFYGRISPPAKPEFGVE